MKNKKDIYAKIEDLKAHYLLAQSSPILISVRGFYAPLWSNFIDIYDDLLAIYQPDGHFYLFKANCDPSRIERGMAVIQPGCFQYKIGIHGITRSKEQQYEALVQASSVNILRAGVENSETGYFGINIHQGGRSSTGSEGCLTLHPDEWRIFLETTKNIMKAYQLQKINLIVTDVHMTQTGRRFTGV